MVTLHARLADYLGLEKIKTLIGPSLGGQQALEWAVTDHQRFENVCVIAANAKHSAWGVAFNESQRMALWSDETFRSNFEDGGKFGLRTARAIALLSYRSYDCYQSTQNEAHDYKIDSYRASSYQNYQGDKIVKRFSPYSYWILSKAMDSQNIGRNRGGVRKTLGNLSVKLLTIGISTDVLFPPSEQEEIAQYAKYGIFKRIDSIYGHDGFLIEGKQLNKILLDLHEERLRPTTYTKLKSNYLN
jgi:homoserine O-acetyltransferase